MWNAHTQTEASRIHSLHMHNNGDAEVKIVSHENGNPYEISERNMKGVFSHAYPGFITLYFLVSSDRCGRESLELTDSQFRNGKHAHSLNVNKTSMHV